MFALTKTQNKTLDLALTLVASTLFFFLCAKSRIYTSFSPVPITMHTFGVLFLGALLPFRYSAISFSVFLVEGLIGSPIFGAPILYAATGYYVGMFLGLYVLSSLSNRAPLLLAMVIASALNLGLGVLHLQFMMGWKSAFMVGVVPFIVGDVMKLILAYALVKGIMNKRSNSTAI